MKTYLKHLLNEKYVYLLMLLVAAGFYISQMYCFNRFLDDMKNSRTYLDWGMKDALIRDIHRHPARYPEYTPDGEYRPKPDVTRSGAAATAIKTELPNAVKLNTSNMIPFSVKHTKDTKDNITNLVYTLDAPAGKHGFVKVQDGHFYYNGQRFQIAGINNAYESNFPSREDADLTAERLARFGFNCVRLHHCDQSGFWGKDAKLNFDPDKLDKFDYFVNALRERGIYVELELHVTRTLGNKESIVPSNILYDKGINTFNEDIRKLDKKFAADLLNHVNPHTKNAYKDEPCVALIEMNNENSICQVWKNGQLNDADDFYLNDLRNQWNEFLSAKYSGDAGLRTAVGFVDEPLGTEMLIGSRENEPKRLGMTTKFKFNNTNDVDIKYIIPDENNPAAADKFFVEIQNKSAAAMKRLTHSGIKLQKDQLYTYAVTVKADRPASILLRRDNGKSLKFYLDDALETYSFPFIAETDTDDGTVSIEGFNTDTAYTILSMSLKPGGQISYPKIDSRIRALEDTLDLYTTSEIKQNWLKPLATLNILPIQNAGVQQSVQTLDFRVRAGKKYRFDVLATGSSPDPVSFVFKQDGKILQEIGGYKNDKELYPSVDVQDAKGALTKKYVILSYIILSESDKNITVTPANLKRFSRYNFDFITFREVHENVNEKLSLDTKNIPILFNDVIQAYPQKLQDEWCEFLLYLDKKHWADMYSLLKDEIKVKQPVTGTQLEYGSVHAQGKMDFCDIHSYWDHPVFPNIAWNAQDWFCHNQPLIISLAASPLLNMATKRIANKPFVCSEYDHTWVNRYSGEGLPLLAVFAARQGWDGILPFCWGGSEAETAQMTGWFEMWNNPVKLAHMAAVNNLIRRDFNKSPEEDMIVLPLSEETELELMKEHQNTYNFGFKGLGIDFRHALTRPCGIDLTGTSALPLLSAIPENKNGFSDKKDGNYFQYTGGSNTGKCWLSAMSGETAVFTGFVSDEQKYPFGGGTIEFGETNMGWATVTMTLIFENEWKKRYLLAATGSMQNTDQQYQIIHNNKVTLNDAGIDTTGTAPILCEVLSACVSIKSDSQVTYYVLDGKGSRTSNFIADKTEAGLWEVTLKPDYGTIWYELEADK
jgi:hypothetical protein